MVDLKFAERLKHDLTAIKPVKTHEQVANEIHMAPSALSNLKTGKRSATRDVKKSLVRALGSLKLAMSAARSEFGVLSFLDDKKRRLDSPFTTSLIQYKEEQERIQAQHDYDLAICKQPQERTAGDVAAIKKYFKEYFEEIASEETDVQAKAIDAGLDDELQAMINQFNRQYGG
ncbi:helix-turn-helix domain-containing protein [Secundilactobacillus kimchicus]|uniref:helix-turn-helix domain-containing protein n=1 Tax=Secundilactobacillus kimchicus TaxID=528209 RepID=UPI0024A9D3DB|nr:helix-turn-helix transcriptional regulator [Secundilactobacillus kimchicus]